MAIDDGLITQAAGGIVWREGGGGEEVLLVHRERYGDWTLPKGKLRDTGETFQDAAIREVGEETGCTVRLGEYLGAIGYEVDGHPKAVLFWRMTCVKQAEIKDRSEVAAVEWLPTAAAIARLTHEREKEFLARYLSRRRAYQSPGALDVRSRKRRWFWSGGSRARVRLLRELEVFRVELSFLEQRSANADTSWAGAARDHLSLAKQYFDNCDVEGGWYSLQAARRLTVFGLCRSELTDRARMVRAEAEKLASWRGKAAKELLSVADDRLTATQLIEAMALRDEYTGNEYHKLWLMADQLGVLLVVAVVALLAFVVSAGFLTSLDGRVLWLAPLAGLLGAAFSTAQSFITNSNPSRIPERVANHFVTLARLIFGGVAGLAGYLFVNSELLNIKLGSNTAIAALAVAFLFGYTGERFVAGIATSMAGRGTER